MIEWLPPRGSQQGLSPRVWVLGFLGFLGFQKVKGVVFVWGPFGLPSPDGTWIALLPVMHPCVCVYGRPSSPFSPSACRRFCGCSRPSHRTMWSSSRWAGVVWWACFQRSEPRLRSPPPRRRHPPSLPLLLARNLLLSRLLVFLRGCGRLGRSCEVL